MRFLFSAENVKAGSFASLLFVYAVLALSVSAIHYTETLHRVTTLRVFDESVFGSSSVDSLAAIGFSLLFFSATFRSKDAKAICVAVFGIAIGAFLANQDLLVITGLVTLPILATLIILAKFADRRTTSPDKPSIMARVRIDSGKFAAAFLVIIIIIEFGALARWISYPFFPTEIYSDPSWRIAELESALFHSLGLLSPIFVALIGFSFLYRWYILNLLQKLYNFFLGRKKARSAATTPKKIPDASGKRSNESRPMIETGRKEGPVLVKQVPARTQRARILSSVIFSGALIFAPLLMIYPHLPAVNPGAGGVSTDEQYYLNWLSTLRSDEHLGGPQIVSDAFIINNGDRPLTLLLIMGIANLTVVPDIMVIRYLPVALAPALVASVYVLIRDTVGSKKDESVGILAALAALVTAISPQVVVGQYAGLLANWLALVAGYFAFLFMIKIWDSASKHQLALYSASLFATLLLVMLIHLYTWSHLLVVTLLFCGLSYIFSRKNTNATKTKVLITLLIVGASFAVDYGRSLYFENPPLAGSDSALVKNIQPEEEQKSGWDRLQFALGFYVGGFLSNPALFILALIWVVAKADFSKGLDRILIAMAFIIALPILIGTTEFQTRVLYNTPIQVLAILALYPFARQSSYPLSRALLIGTIIAVTATFALRAMANLYLALPEGYVLDKQFLLP